MGRLRRYSEYSLGTYLLCPRKFFFRYIELRHTPSAPTVSNAIGGAIHNACREFYDIPAEKRDREALFDLFRDIWKRNSLKRFFANRDEEREAGERCLGMLERFYEHFGKHKPLSTEQYLEHDFNRFILFGRTDRVDLDESGGLEIVDYKTNRFFEAEGGERERQTLQLKIYAVLMNSKQKPVVRGMYFYLPDNQFDVLDFTHENIAYAQTFIEDLIDDIEHDTVFAASAGSHCKFCDFKKQCMAETGRETPRSAHGGASLF
jgi:CRISPR/Cas system-associated exonuclease Cas4 (RecB family)